MSEKLDVSYSLTEEEKRIFRKFKRSNSAKLTKSEFQTMLRSKLVDGGFGGEYYWFSNGSFDEGVACLSENGLRVKAAMRADIGLQQELQSPVSCLPSCLSSCNMG